MDISSTGSVVNEKEAEIHRQIAALKAQLERVKADSTTPSTPGKRKHLHIEGSKIIAARTPSPKKRKLDLNQSAKQSNLPLQQKPKTNQPKPNDPPKLPLIQPSKLLSNLATARSQSNAVAEPIERTVGFSEVPAKPKRRELYQERDDRLALIEKLEPCPHEHKPLVDDPHFQRLEPYSNIHLTSRILPHGDFEEHLRGRYYLSPSLLYSVIRPLPSNQGYDIPVPGDWVTIAVIAERGPIKLTSTSNTTLHDDEETISNNKGRGKQKAEQEDKKTRGKKYMSLKLVDFGTRSHGTPKAQVRGDALLTLLLFEADSWSYIGSGGCPAKGSKTERPKIYKGGSGGAFEACMKLHEGAVIAILNPRILKPYQHHTTTPHPTDNILAITPTSAQSIAILGQSRDLGMCTATKRDGKICGSWCDKRVSDCCEYHVEYAVKRKRAGRAEFSIGTSGMSTTANGRRPAFDPDRKWGLLPAPGVSKSNTRDDGGSTYVIPGHVISSAGRDYVDEKIGRGREERVRRRREEKKTDEMLNRLLGRDGGGGDRNPAAGAVRKAREVMKTLKGEKVDMKRRGKEKHDDKKSGFSAEMIKKLGFDPTTQGNKEGNAEDAKRKLDVLASLQKERGDIRLCARPGARIRSGVHVPIAVVSDRLAEGEDSDELEILSETVIGAEE